MPTIKDVAKLAGVSHGTVSNVINGLSSVSLENVKKVQEAILTLGYKPDAAAQSLKASNSLEIAVVLPYITDNLYAHLYTAIDEACTLKGYDTALFVTSEIAELEKRILERIRSRKFAGAIIVTCQPENLAVFKELIDSDIKLVLVEREVGGLDCNFVGFQNDKSIHYAVTSARERGCERIALITGPAAYSSEILSQQGYAKALSDVGVSVDAQLIRTTNFTSESAFCAAIDLMSCHSPPEAIICTSTQLTSGVLGAMKLICNGNPPVIFSLGEDIWNDSRYSDANMLPRSCLKMGEMITSLLLDNIHNSSFFECQRIYLNNVEVNFIPKNADKQTAPTNKLKILMLDDSMSHAIRSLLPDLKRNRGINAEIVTLTHDELYDELLVQKGKSDFDVFSIDILWLREFAAKGLLLNLTPCFDEDFADSIDVQPELFDEFARYNNMIYAIPYQYCSQLLFYRKDLFENVGNRRMFFDLYRTELKCPQTWTEFNAVAKFFTRTYNPESETEFGATLGGRFSSAAVCEFLPRFWAYNAEVFDHHGRVTLYTPNAVKALQNYCESYLFASPDSPNNWWHEQVAEFTSGKAAMMVMFSSYVSSIMDRSRSSITGKVSFGNIPSDKPVLGGWSYALNPAGTQPEAALEFVKWACSSELAIPETLLGNLSACRKVFMNNKIKSLYPWIPKSLEVFPTTKRRVLPKDKVAISIKEYEEIIAEAVHDSILGKITPNDALRRAAGKMTLLLGKA